ncbi:MAG: CAP domain-containing protein [Candidatus Sulfotelmatobacter sp.]
MPRALITVFKSLANRRLPMLLLLVMAADPGRPSTRLMAASENDDGPKETPTHSATLKPASATSPDIPFTEFDLESERILLELANEARAKAGAPPLKLDGGLCQAARAHASAMFAARELSHQFDGEPSVPQRLAAASRAQLDQEGENVALDFDAEKGHEHLMLSAPHRANLLNGAYNVVGMAVVRSGDRLYIVQDFGHALPTYSMAEWKDRIAAALLQARHQAKQPALARRDFLGKDLTSADEAACSMAQVDQFGTAPVQQLAQRYSVFTYTSLHPDTLPGNAALLVASHNLHSFSVGACYARTATYPAGVYWVVLSLD